MRAFVRKKTKDVELADDLVDDVFLKMTHTRRWNPAKRPFGAHFMLCVKSELNHYFASKAPEKQALAHEGFHRDERPKVVRSVEEEIVSGQTEREHAAARDLQLLRERTADHELMSKVISCIKAGSESPATIAVELGVPVQQVYRALEGLRRHAKKIREG